MSAFYHALLTLALTGQPALANGDFTSPIAQNASGAAGTRGVWQSVLTSWGVSGGQAVYNPASGPYSLFQDIVLPAGTYQLTTVATLTGNLSLNLENTPDGPQMSYVAAGLASGTQVHTFTLAAPTPVRIDYIPAYDLAAAAIESVTLRRV